MSFWWKLRTFIASYAVAVSLVSLRGVDSRGTRVIIDTIICFNFTILLTIINDLECAGGLKFGHQTTELNEEIKGIYCEGNKQGKKKNRRNKYDIKRRQK